MTFKLYLKKLTVHTEVHTFSEKNVPLKDELGTSHYHRVSGWV
jgi:hypothetical protein